MLPSEHTASSPRPSFGSSWRISPGARTLLINACVFVALASWSWRRWPDPLIDFGRELYVPWQIMEGRVLYRDIASLFGPLSPYVNAGFFRLFGVSLTTLIACNLAIFAATLAGIHYLLRVAGGTRLATTGTLAVLPLFGFGQHAMVGNYNFVCPYSHEATHGMALTVAMLVALQVGFTRERRRWFAVAGLAFGLVLLTKPEVAVAAGLALAVGVGAMAIAAGRNGRELGARVAILLLAAAVPPLLFFWYFTLHLPPGAALEATAGAWSPLWTADLADTAFYRRVSGLDDPQANAALMLLAFAGCAVFVAVAGLVDYLSVRRRERFGTPLARRALLILVVAVSALAAPRFAVHRALTLTTATVLIWILVAFVRERGNRESAVRLLPLLMWASFALALLAKIVLNTGLTHYGFYLALPATTILIAALIELVPRWLASRDSPGAGVLFQRIAMWMVAAGVAPYLVVSASYYRLKVVPVGSGWDRFYATKDEPLWQGAAAREALEAIESLSAPGDQVAVLPEGIMLNYLSRRRSPLAAPSLMPPEIMVFGQDSALRSLQDGPPELVLLVRRDVAEYDYPPFGTTARYGRDIVAWVAGHYELVREISRDPTTGAARIQVLRRRAQR